jgi:hypothetical protein
MLKYRREQADQAGRNAHHRKFPSSQSRHASAGGAEMSLVLWLLQALRAGTLRTPKCIRRPSVVLKLLFGIKESSAYNHGAIGTKFCEEISEAHGGQSDIYYEHMGCK